MRSRRTLLIMGLVGAVAALAIVGTSLAQTAPPTPTPGGTKANYGQYFLDRLAGALGIGREELNGALKQARNETLDKAVQDGKLPQDRADRLKAQEGLAPFGPGFRGIPKLGNGGRKPGGPLGAAPFLAGAEVRDAVAKALGLTPEQLTTELRAGKSLKELAQGDANKEQAVKDAILSVAKQQLDKAVANKRLTQEQADQAYNRLKDSDLLAGGWLGRGMDKRFFRAPGKDVQPSRNSAPLGARSL